jgi:hypothetical protein
MATNNATNTSNPVTVPQGGTGDSSLTAYAVVCGGTTSTGALQSVSGVGTSGQVLTSNGASALPTWQAAPAGGGITTIDGDSGSATGSTITFNANSNSGSSVKFVASSATVDLEVTDANGNTIIGSSAGNGSISGSQNTGAGQYIFTSLTSGNFNTGLGRATFFALSSGSENTAIGFFCLASLGSGGSNTVLGYNSGYNYTGAESSNILIGAGVFGTASESNVLRIGNGTGTSTGQLNKAFISGITGITVTGTAVLVSSSNQLGIAVSSRRYKENIQDMGSLSSSILDLRPVSFSYTVGDDRSIQTGLIAEEVEEVMPSLCAYDNDGVIQAVKYHDLPVLLLNELQKALKRIEALESKI